MARAPRLALATLLLAALPAAPARDPRASAEELRDLRARIETLQRDLGAAEKSASGAAEQLRESDRALSEAHRGLFALQEERRAIEAELQDIGRREGEARAGVAAQQALAERLLRFQYQQGSADRLRLILEGRDASTVARHIVYYGYVQKARAGAIAGLRETAERLQGLDREARERRDALATNEAAREREAHELEKRRTGHLALVQRAAADIDKGRREIGRLKRDEARLARLVEEITRALATRETKPAAPGRKVERVADASVSAKPFGTLKGRLKLPVRGELANQFGAARDDTGAQWKGLFIRTATGETVHAIADGRVVYADWLRGFGNLLILDHGGGYMSLYANNEGLFRQVGENVRGGEPLASVGASGGHAESGLYFELRRDGKPFDPLKWMVL